MSPERAPRLTFAAARIELPERFVGVSLTPGEPDPDGRTRDAQLDAERVVPVVDGVRVTDDDSGLVYLVAPVEQDGRAALLYYAESMPSGELLPLDAPRLDRRSLSVLALDFLRRAAEGTTYAEQPTPPHALGRRRPDDAALLEVMRWAIAESESPRQLLAARYGVALATADDWIKYARKLPAAADLPPARRGRPRKRVAPATDTGAAATITDEGTTR